MRTLFIHGWLILPSGIQKKNLLMEDGIISALGEGTMDADEIVDVKGLYIAPGFIDIHLHGAGGHDFMEGSVEAFQAISDYHLFRGTTGIVPTAVSASLAGQIRFLDGYRKAQDSGLIRSRLLGAHLEGPYLSTVKSGAHDVQYLKNPDPNEYERLISDYPFIKRFTIAPELKGAMAMGRTLHDHGINASIGHSDAHGKEIAEAERNGFTSVTHLYNAMSSQGTYNGQKAAGVAEMALLLKNLYVELIADLKHVPPELILLTYQAKTADKMILVTDCLSPAGMKEGPFFIGEKTAGMQVDVRDAAYLHGTEKLAGSIVSADVLLKNIVSLGIPLEEGVKMLTKTPAMLLGLPDVGSLEIGKAADLVVFDDKTQIKHVFCKGIQIR